MRASRVWPERLVASLLLSAAVAVLSACGGDPGTGPAEVKWDRDVCERCLMILSDRRFSAQIRGWPKGDRSRVYYFDDVGCGMLWLDQQPWKDDPRVEFWVNDHRDGHWIDARKAWYVRGFTTPMEYGLGAQDEPAEGALAWEEARKLVYEIEERFTQEAGVSLDPARLAPSIYGRDRHAEDPDHEHDHDHGPGEGEPAAPPVRQ
ncbi:MAG: hypothetical protein PHF72_02890 [Gammaproteobacteria bacterium]|nr:hypothetical protein [Gammaproteobacteria bacterium]